MYWLKKRIYEWVLSWKMSDEDANYFDEEPMVTIWIDSEEDMIYYESNVTPEMTEEMVETVLELMKEPVAKNVVSIH